MANPASLGAMPDEKTKPIYPKGIPILVSPQTCSVGSIRAKKIPGVGRGFGCTCFSGFYLVLNL